MKGLKPEIGLWGDGHWFEKSCKYKEEYWSEMNIKYFSFYLRFYDM